MDEQQALFDKIQLADGTMATAAETKLIDLIIQEAKEFEKSVINFITTMMPRMKDKILELETITIPPSCYQTFLNSKASVHLIRLLGGADLALEIIRAKPKTARRKNYPLLHIQSFFRIIFLTIACAPEANTDLFINILSEALTELHFEKVKNPWDKVCKPATYKRLAIALYEAINRHSKNLLETAPIEKIEKLEKQLKALEVLKILAKNLENRDTLNPQAKDAAQITAKAIFTAELLHKATGALPDKNEDGSYPKSLTIVGTARKEERKRNRKTGQEFLAPTISNKLVLMIPAGAQIEAATPNDFFTYDDMEIVSYITGEVLKYRNKQKTPTIFSADGLPLIEITPTEVFRALCRNPNAIPNTKAIQEINNTLEKLHSRLKCRIDNDKEDKILHRATSTKSFKPILPYHDKKQVKRADGDTYTVYYYTLYVSAFAGYAINHKYYTMIDINKTLIYKLNAKGKITQDEEGQPTTPLAQIRGNRRKLIYYLERRILNKNATSRTIRMDKMLDKLRITERKERKRAIDFIPTILENFKRYEFLTNYKINDTKIDYSIPSDTGKIKTQKKNLV